MTDQVSLDPNLEIKVSETVPTEPAIPSNTEAQTPFGVMGTPEEWAARDAQNRVDHVRMVALERATTLTEAWMDNVEGGADLSAESVKSYTLTLANGFAEFLNA